MRAAQQLAAQQQAAQHRVAQHRAAQQRAADGRSRAAEPELLPTGEPPDGAEYTQILRGPTYLWWRSLLGVVMGLSLFLLATSLVSQVVLALAWITTAADQAFTDYSRRAFAFELPSGMLAANLGIATLIPISWLLIAMVHRVRPRWLSSVQPRIRWRYLLVCAAVAVVVLNGVLVLSNLTDATPVWQVQPGFWGFLVVIVLTSPLQAVAEELFFRGYLLQALGSLLARPWFGIVVSALVFAAFHGGQNLALFVDRLAFGLVAGVLVWRTGGLEAGIAAHVVNNVFAYLIAGVTTGIAAVRGITSITWVDAAFDVGGFVLVTVLALLVAHRMRLRTRVDLSLGR